MREKRQKKGRFWRKEVSKGMKVFLKAAIRFYAINIGELIRELLPHYKFFQNWETCSENRLEEVLHVYKYWLGVELDHKEYVLKFNSFSPDEQEKRFRDRVHLLRRMYRDLPEEFQKEVVQ